MNINKSSVMRLLIVVILGALSPCVCAWLYSLQPSSFAKLFTSVDARLLEMSVIAAVCLLPDVWASIAYSRHPTREVTASPRDGLIQNAIQRASVILLVMYVGVQQPTGLASVGLQPHTNLFAIAIMSVATCSLFAIPLTLYGRVRPNKPKVDASRPDAKMVLAYRTPRQRFGWLIVLVFAAVAEDLVYRGYLVLLLSARTGTPIVWAVISVTLSVVIHLYQGRTRIPYHIMVASVFVFASIVTGNILVALGAHLWINLWGAILIWDWADKEAAQVQEPAVPTPDVA